MPKIPWNKVREKVAELSESLWLDEEDEIRRIVDTAPKEEKIISVAFTHTVDCSGDMPTIKSKISFSEKFSLTVTGSVDDPAQMTLGEANGKKEESAK